MQRKKIFRRATKHEAQLKRSGAEEFAEEFPEGPLGAPPAQNEEKIFRHQKNDKKKE